MRTDKFYILFLVLLLAAGVYVFVQCTPYGVGLVSDSVNYINGARSIAAGNGYFRESGGGTLKPITNFTPLYSMILAVPVFFGMDGILASWWVSLIFFILNLGMVVCLIRKAGGCKWVSLAGGLLFLALRPFLYFQFFAMSEPVFFFFTLLTFILLIDAYRRGSLWQWFVCGLAAGCAFLARYIGVTSICAVLAVILIFAMEKKGRVLLSFSAGVLPLVVGWLVRNTLVSGNASNRQTLVHFVTADDMQNGVLIFWRWLYPERYGSIETPAVWMMLALALFLIAALVFILALMVLHLTKKKSPPVPVMVAWALLLYIVGYLAVVVLTISLFDASVNIEERILLPAFMTALLLLLTLTGWMWRVRRKLPALLLSLFVIFFLIVFAQDTLDNLPAMAETGYGWGWEGWQTSPAMQLVRRLPKETQVYSNQQEAISLWAGRGAYALLDPIDPSSNQLREGYAETMQIIRQQVLDGEAVLVFFGIESWLGDSGDNWVSQLCDGLPFVYQDSSEWVIGKEELLQ